MLGLLAERTRYLFFTGKGLVGKPNPIAGETVKAFVAGSVASFVCGRDPQQQALGAYAARA